MAMEKIDTLVTSVNKRLMCVAKHPNYKVYCGTYWAINPLITDLQTIGTITVYIIEYSNSGMVSLIPGVLKLSDNLKLSQAIF